MALFAEAFKDVFVFREKHTASNGMGGFDVIYTDGERFSGALTTDQSTEAKIAEKQGVTVIQTLTVPPDVPLDFGDRIKSVETGVEYRITSRKGTNKTPSVASFQFQNFSVERVD